MRLLRQILSCLLPMLKVTGEERFAGKKVIKSR